MEILGSPDPMIALRDFLIRSIVQITHDQRRRRVIEILFRKCEYVEEFEDAARRLQEWSAHIVGRMTAIFQEAGEKALLADGLSPDIAALATYSLVTGFLSSWMIRAEIDDVAAKAPDVISAFFRSLHRQVAAPPPLMALHQRPSLRTVQRQLAEGFCRQLPLHPMVELHGLTEVAVKPEAAGGGGLQGQALQEPR